MDFKKVLTGEEILSNKTEIDLSTNRNSKMIQALMRNGVNGLFLYYLRNDDTGNGQGFVLPPGLPPEEMENFKSEFSKLFEKYARIANRS